MLTRVYKTGGEKEGPMKDENLWGKGGRLGLKGTWGFERHMEGKIYKIKNTKGGKSLLNSGFDGQNRGERIKEKEGGRVPEWGLNIIGQDKKP